MKRLAADICYVATAVALNLAWESLSPFSAPFVLVALVVALPGRSPLAALRLGLIAGLAQSVLCLDPSIFYPAFFSMSAAFFALLIAGWDIPPVLLVPLLLTIFQLIEGSLRMGVSRAAWRWHPLLLGILVSPLLLALHGLRRRGAKTAKV